MKNTRITLRILAMVAIMTILAGCSIATTAVVATAVPTEIQASTVSAIMTQAANTVFANLTKNAVTDTPALPTNTLAPSGTPLPTNTPFPTSTPLPPPATATATLIPWTRTPIFTSTPVYTATLTTYNCTLSDASPKSTNKITPGMDFDGQWVVKNTGSETWLHTEIDLKYVSGTKFQTKGDLFNLNSDVAKNESYTVIVDMLAPATVGTYYATWTLAHGSLSFCTMNLTLVVTN